MRNLLSNVKGILNDRRGIGFIEYMIGAAVVVALAVTTYGLIGGGARKTSNSLGTDMSGFKATVSGNGSSGNFAVNAGNATTNGIQIQ